MINCLGNSGSRESGYGEYGIELGTCRIEIKYILLDSGVVNLNEKI